MVIKLHVQCLHHVPIFWPASHADAMPVYHFLPVCIGKLWGSGGEEWWGEWYGDKLNEESRCCTLDMINDDDEALASAPEAVLCPEGPNWFGV